ncbi:MAG: ATP-dependent protease LonB [Thermaerobacter sp.]|nr:ATP-dependent protease LonB [Thermaerobacter sp.]
MDYAAGIFTFVQFFFAVVIGLYFWNLLRTQQGSRVAIDRESRKEVEKLRQLRDISLTEPLSERTRPTRMNDIVGQEEGIRALRAALCGPNPQHVLIYGPPGVGKTAAARLVLEEAKKRGHSPFKPEAKFIELDATTARFDERGIADPLIGSVHDPIYQGAGAMGMAGIPQPKPGAVTKAHGGMLFIDEIGELHPMQMNKLLKVLEDRKVFLESAYYSSEDPNIPRHIQDIFENGLPADFRLVGATTRQSEDLPPALRSRCVEVFFRPLRRTEVLEIAAGAARKVDLQFGDGALEVVADFAQNGREAVNIVQIAASLVFTESRQRITRSDVEWVVNAGQYSPRIERKMPSEAHIGVATGLAVVGPNVGMILEVEATARHVGRGRGRLRVTGMVEEEELGARGRTLRRKSMGRSSVENVLTLLQPLVGQDLQDYDLHVNLPGGMPVDGPSAGVTIAAAIYSAVVGRPIDHLLAMTGELSIHGEVRPVGGVPAKVQAAVDAGARRVLVPKENDQERLHELGVDVVTVSRFSDVLEYALLPAREQQGAPTPVAADRTAVAAAPLAAPQQRELPI